MQRLWGALLYTCVYAKLLQSCPTLWIVAHQAPLSMEFSRQEYWIGLPFPPPGDLPDPGIEPSSPVLSSALEGGFFFFFLTTEPSRSYRKVSFLLSTQDFFHFTNKMNQSQEDGSRILKLKRTLSKYFVLFPYLYASASKIPNMKPGRSFSEDLQEGEFPIVNSKMKAGMCNLGRSLASHGCSPSLLTTP